MVEATERAHEDGDEDALPQAEDGLAQRRAPFAHAQKAAEIGEGIGLSIVKRLCELLGVAIELESVANRGTTFRLRIPTELTAPATAVDLPSTQPARG